MSAPYEVKWGILGCGWIASVFVKDLIRDPATRGVSDVVHKVAAVGTSNDLPKAQKFLSDYNVPEGAVAYGSYADLLADPNVDIVYVATPHSHHYPHVLQTLQAGKHVLCEKPFTVNAEQAKILFDIAKSKNLFIMEAVWTRFLPLAVEVRDLVSSGTIGDVKRVVADISCHNESVETAFQPNNRMVNMDLAGGALLDLGVYALTWVFQILYHLDPEAKTPEVLSHVQKYEVTGCDETTTIICKFPKATGVALTSFRIGNDYDGEGTGGPGIRIFGTKGEIQVAHPCWKPLKYRVILPKDQGGAKEWEHRDAEGGGWFWQADACGRALRDGKIESEVMPWKETISILEVMDKALRSEGVVYPDSIDSTAHPLKDELLA